MKKLLFFLGILSIAAGPSMTFADTTTATSPVVAQIGSVTITKDQMDQDAALQLSAYQMQTDLYNKKRAWLDKKTHDILYAQAAKDAKLSPGAWHKKEIDDTVIPPTQADIDAQVQQYTQQAAQRGQLVSDPKIQDQMKKQAGESLLMQRKAQREQQVYTALVQKYPVTVNLPMPEAPNVKIPYNADDPVKGPAGARVTIVEYTDFQCPYCKHSQDTLHQVLAAYPNDVKLVAKAYPLPFHNRARPSAEAAFCAKEQGKYWEFREKAFASSPQLEDTDFMTFAKDIGLNTKKFGKCYQNHTYAARVDADIASGQDVGVQGTPHFFVNTEVINGAQPFDAFKKAIDTELAKK
jgi:protein-disulfide isomerase